MRTDKMKRMQEAAGNIGNCAGTLNAILAKIPDELKEKLNGADIGVIVKLLDDSYNDGKASAGAEIIDGEDVWIGQLSAMYSIDDIKKLEPTYKVII